ncbi:MAG: hypothetical protein MUC50_14230 [Myxococcota bacterium]|nr:hypothetical protein [Myxococcota bacterium]
MKTAAPSAATARAWLLCLQETVHAAALHRVPSILRTHEGFWQWRLAPDYSVVEWLRDPTVERERRQRLRSAVGKAPFLETLHDEAELSLGLLAEATWEGQRGLGIGLAVLQDATVVSLPVPPFCTDPLPVVMSCLDADVLKEKAEQVCNFYDAAAVARRGPWIAQRQQHQLRSGSAIIRLRADFLEKLDFTGTALDQLAKLTGSERTFPFIVRHLFALNEHARQWDGKRPFAEGYPFPCSEESSTTLAMYGGTRTFVCPDGEKRLFSWHSKINYEKWRIHFVDVPPERTVLIGYIGKHLPLAG